MKKYLFYSGFIFALLFTTAFKFTSLLPIGSDLPKATLLIKDTENEDISMKDAARKNGLLVMFSCNTCPYVMKNQERTRTICKYALQNNIGVILLNSNEEQRNTEESLNAMRQYAKAQKYEWYYAVDKNYELADAFGATKTLENFLFDKNMKLVYHGAIDDNPADAKNVKRQHVRQAINEMLLGKDISVKESRGIGCAIRRK